MKNTRLAEIIVDPASCTGDEAKEIIILTDQFPYSAVLHILQAKIATENKTPDKDKFLTRAAIISADRSQLKQYITTKKVLADYKLVSELIEKESTQFIPGEDPKIETAIIQSPPEEKPATQIIPELIKTVPPLVSLGDPSIKAPSGHKLVEELMENLAVYRDQIKKFNDTLADLHKAPNQDNSVESSLSDIPDEGKSDDISRPPRKRKSSGKLAKEEQDQLINKFIETEAEIKKSVKSEEKVKKSKEDLSQVSSEFSDETVTETLAGIMVSQGKLEKAIEIYRKLIWKLPQKKAYFASQIELLKEKISKQ